MPRVTTPVKYAGESEKKRGSTRQSTMKRPARIKSMMNQDTNAGDGLKGVPRGKCSRAVMI
jgi:hypothetical protein